jgi:hypothetical protein
VHELLVYVKLFRIDGAVHPHNVDNENDTDDGITGDDNVGEARPIHL